MAAGAGSSSRKPLTDTATPSAAHGLHAHTLRRAATAPTAACRVTCAAVVALLVLAIAAAPVHGQIYVTNGDTGTVGAYNFDGTPINTALITGLQHPQGIAVSDGYIYVASSDPLSDLGGTIGKYTTAGATVNAALLSGLPSPLHGIAVSGNDLYVTQQSSAWVGKYTTAGATVDATFVAFFEFVSDPVGVAVSGTDLFVTNEIPGVVGHFTTAGATIDEEMIDTGPGTFPYSLAISGTTMFISQNGGEVSAWTTSGVPIDTQLIPYLPGASGIAVLGDRLFVESSYFGTVGVYNLDGTPVNKALISGLGTPIGIAVVPEPTPALLVLLPLAVASLRRRRPRRPVCAPKWPFRVSKTEATERRFAMKRSTKRALAATALYVAAHMTLAHAAPGDVRNLGDFGGVRSDGFAINNAAQVTGYYETDLPADGAFRYDPTAGAAVPFDLGTLGSKYSVGYDINASGQVVGDSFISDTGIRHAFRYDGTPGAGGVMRDLGTLGPRDSFAYGINRAGQVTGAFDSNDLSFNIHAFVYSGTPGSGGAMLDLGTLPGGSSSIGRSINSAGHIVGEATGFPAFAFHAFLYRGTPGAGGSMVDLGTLGGSNSAAEDINDSGQIAGFSYMPGDNTLHAFRYTGTRGAGGVMVDLGVPTGASDSTGYSIDIRGNVVGFAATPADVRHAALWPINGSAIDLDAWLDQTNPAAGAFWTLKYAYGINDNGLITGEGFYDDGPAGLTDGIRAYVLDASSLTAVPEPSALPAIAVAAATLLRRRRRRRHAFRYQPEPTVR
jgi:probable HAF family extracellular repeat protein